jgi:hypothetical protein
MCEDDLVCIVALCMCNVSVHIMADEADGDGQVRSMYEHDFTRVCMCSCSWVMCVFDRGGDGKDHTTDVVTCG